MSTKKLVSVNLIGNFCKGKSCELVMKDGAINATFLGKIKETYREVTRFYNPFYMKTISCISKISLIDGDKGILEYRG